MNKVPRVSVVLPVYNNAATIQRALNSVGAQAFRDFEIIVVDDGSSDDTAAIVEAAAMQNLTLIRHEANRGAAAARNTALRVARGDLIAFLDSDDSWRTDKLSRQVALIDVASPAVRACTSGYYIHRSSGAHEVRIELAPGEFKSTILFGCSISPGTTLLVERRAFDDVGPFDEALQRLEDWDWLLRFTERYDMCSVPEPLADVYLSDALGAYSSKMKDSVFRALQKIRTKHIPRLQSGRQRRQFISSILIERAALRYRDGHALHAALTVALAFAVFPRRNSAFFRMLMRSTLRSIKTAGYRES